MVLMASALIAASMILALAGVVLGPGTVRSAGRSGDVCLCVPLMTRECLEKSGAGRFLVRTSASMSTDGQSISLTVPSLTRSRSA